MFFGLREHVVRSNPQRQGSKVPFDPNIIIIHREDINEEGISNYSCSFYGT